MLRLVFYEDAKILFSFNISVGGSFLSTVAAVIITLSTSSLDCKLGDTTKRRA